MDAVLKITNLLEDTNRRAQSIEKSTSDTHRAIEELKVVTDQQWKAIDDVRDVAERSLTLAKETAKELEGHMRKEDEIPGRVDKFHEENVRQHEVLSEKLLRIEECVNPELQAARARVLKDLKKKIAEAGPLAAMALGIVKFVITLLFAVWLLGKTHTWIWPK